MTESSENNSDVEDQPLLDTKNNSSDNNDGDAVGNGKGAIQNAKEESSNSSYGPIRHPQNDLSYKLWGFDKLQFFHDCPDSKSVCP